MSRVKNRVQSLTWKFNVHRMYVGIMLLSELEDGLPDFGMKRGSAGSKIARHSQALELANSAFGTCSVHGTVHGTSYIVFDISSIEARERRHSPQIKAFYQAINLAIHGIYHPFTPFEGGARMKWTKCRIIAGNISNLVFCGISAFQFASRLELNNCVFVTPGVSNFSSLNTEYAVLFPLKDKIRVNESTTLRARAQSIGLPTAVSRIMS